MQNLRFLFLSTLMGISALSASPGLATTFEMKTLPALTRSSIEPNCPQRITVNEAGQPYQEGGYTIDGSANLTAIATNIKFAESQYFSVTWKGDLKPEFRYCLGSAGISSVDGEPFERNSHLRVRYEQGQVFFTVDMVGQQDANNYTTSITFQDIVNGNPKWSWSGSD